MSPDRSNPGACRSCGAPILWILTGKSDKAIPLDLKTRSDGNLVIENGYAVNFQPLLHSGHDRYGSHFATCPQAEQWRRLKVRG